MKLKPVIKFILSFLLLGTNLIYLNHTSDNSSFRRIRQTNPTAQEKIISYLLQQPGFSTEAKRNLTPEMKKYLPEFFLEHLSQKAAKRGKTLETYLKLLEESLSERQALVRELDYSLSRDTSEMLTYFFRFSSETVKRYFYDDEKPPDQDNGQISKKVARGDYKWNIKSIAGAIGAEAYSIAMILHERLGAYARDKLFSDLPENEKEAKIKEWLGKWDDITIELSDIAAPSLLIAKQGRYLNSKSFNLYIQLIRQMTQYEIELLDKYIIDTDNPEIKEVSPELRAWVKVKPQYINLMDQEQLERLKHQHEVVFFMYPFIPHEQEQEDIIINLVKKFFNPHYKGLLFLSAIKHEVIPPPDLP